MTAFVIFTAFGCGPSAAEIRRIAEMESRNKLKQEVQLAISQVRTIHKDLDSQIAENGLFKQNNPITENDPWGNPIQVTYRKNSEISVTLIVQSNGPDGNPNNYDDIVKSSTRFRNDATKEEIEKTTRGLSRGLVNGVIDSITGRDQNKK